MRSETHDIDKISKNCYNSVDIGARTAQGGINMKYRRLLAVTLAAAVLGMGLAACSKDSDDETEKTEAPAEETEAVADTQGEGAGCGYHL